jgi:hypothetical protein
MKKHETRNRELILSIEQTKQEQSKFLSVGKLATRWGKTDQTIRAWIKSGKLNGIKLFGEYGISIEEVNKIERNNTRNS